MKIDSAAVRRLRTERGWSQDQLATASGLSLRTIQRVETEGAASMATRVCLAATFDVQQAELSAELVRHKEGSNGWPQGIVVLFVGMIIITCALIGESARLPRLPGADATAVINALLGGIGVMMAGWSAVHLVARRQFAAVVLAVLGTPLFTLLMAGLVSTVLSGHIPMWQLDVLGLGGAALMLMALRQTNWPHQHSARA